MARVAGSRLLCGLLLVALGLVLFWQVRQPVPVPLAVSADDDYRYEPVPCWFAPQPGRRLECGHLHTPGTEGGFALPVVVVRSQAADRRPDPLLYIPGGPGGAAELSAEALSAWLDWYDYADLRRDLVLMDPRGTGRSEPLLLCPAYERFSRDLLGRDASLLDELRSGEPVLRACYEQLLEQGFAPEHYGTRASARDLAALMAALAPEQDWNLLGVSYGSRLGMIVPDYTDRVRTLVLDSVYPPEQNSFQQWPELLGQGLARFFEACETSQCHPSGHIEADFYRALAQLREQPLHLSLPLWRESGSLPVVLNDHRFLSAVYSGLYSHYTWPYISQAITGVLAEQRPALQPLLSHWLNSAFSDSFPSLAFMLVDCQDSQPGSRAAYLARAETWPALAPYVADLWDYSVCAWLVPTPTALVDETWRLPELPALLLAGGLDPITPSAWAQSLHAQWPGSQLRVWPLLGHGVVDSEPCALAGLRQFLDHPEQRWAPDCE